MLCSSLFLFRGKLTHTHTCVCNKHVFIFVYDCIALNFLSNITWKRCADLLYQNDKATHYYNLTLNNSNTLCASAYTVRVITLAQNWSNPAHTTQDMSRIQNNMMKQLACLV